jgi:hypothetical protein
MGMNKMTLSPEQFKVFESGNKIETAAGEFFNFPFWIKKDGKTEDGKDLYELYSRSDIPDMESTYKKGGLEKSKYIIQKTDGTQVDPEAWYFVLRIDKDLHAKVAALAYAKSVAKVNIRLAVELISAVLSFNPEEKKISADWAIIYPYKILDHDGWDRDHFNTSWFEEEITWKEFTNRAERSTCTSKDE